jgi:hypothetical protein
MKTNSVSPKVLLLLLSLGCFSHLQAQPFIVSSVPDNAATGVSPSAPVVFTFSEEMNTDTNVTMVQFFTAVPFSILSTSYSWNPAHTILTCTPTPAFPSNQTIFWSVTGENPAGEPLDGTTDGIFSTGSGSGGQTGSGTNQFTTFSVSKQHLYNQTSTAAPLLDPTNSYAFSATTTLASNRTATNVALTLPSSTVTNLTRNFFSQEMFYLFTPSTNLAAFNASYGTGNYVFNVMATSSNQQVTVNLPNVTQPNAPHVANYTSAQSVNPTQAFLLSWDAFSGGTAADYIFVNIGGVFLTANPGVTGALNGTATSVNIPANTLQANSNYDSSIGFYRAVVTSNATYTTVAYIGTATRFSLITSGGATATLILTNMARGSSFSFDVLAPASQTVTVESSSNLLAGSFSSFLTTNTPAGGRFHVTDPRSSSNKFLFYRARMGS